MNTLHPVYV